MRLIFAIMALIVNYYLNQNLNEMVDLIFPLLEDAPERLKIVLEAIVHYYSWLNIALICLVLFKDSE